MKKLICMILVLTFCVCLACPVLADEANDDYMSSPSATEPVCEHTGSTSVVGAKDPTCTEDGYTGDVVCDDCGKVLIPGEVIPAHGHRFVDGVCEICGVSEDNPQTGDTSFVFVWVLVMAVAACALVGVAVAYRKKFANQ